MSVRLDVNGMMADAIGGGVTREEIEEIRPRVDAVAQLLKARRAGGELPFYDLPYQKDAVPAMKTLAASVRGESDTLVVLGIGGSALGTRTLISALDDGTPRVVVADNIDPWSFGRLLEHLDLARTTFNIISKSGETTETMAQFLIVRDLLLRTLGAVDYRQRVVITTDADRGALRQVVHDEGFRHLTIPPGVGGRFAVLSAVALFPAAFAALRIDELLAGAAWMDSRCATAELWRHPAHLLATLLYLADTRHQQRIVVLMPYSDRLRCFAAWFAQLWAESLGKALNTRGEPVHAGQTPIVAVGATDQHSQLQLYADGPPDKVFVMIRVEDHGRELPIPAAYADLEGIGYLGGTGLGELLNREQQSTELALVRRQRPVVTLRLPQINAFTLGQLLYLFEAAVVCAGALHDINPLDQPGVDEGKRLTYAQLGRAGYEPGRTEVEEWTARKRAELIL